MIKMASVVAMMVSVVGCNKKDAGPSAADALKQAEPAVAAVNALIPAAFKGKIAFKAAATEDARAVGIMPDGWGKAFMKGEVEPPKGSSDFGFFTKMQISATCMGECKERDDWAAKIAEFYGTFSADTKPETDEKVGANGRIVVKKMGSTKTLDTLYTVWAKGGAEFLYCKVTLAEESFALQPAFAKACESMIPLRWDNSSN